MNCPRCKGEMEKLTNAFNGIPYNFCRPCNLTLPDTTRRRKTNVIITGEKEQGMSYSEIDLGSRSWYSKLYAELTRMIEEARVESPNVKR